MVHVETVPQAEVQADALLFQMLIALLCSFAAGSALMAFLLL